MMETVPLGTHPLDMHPKPAFAATRRTATARGGAERNPGSPHPATPRPNGVNGDHTNPVPCALSGHRARCVAWSFTGRPFGARERYPEGGARIPVPCCNPFRVGDLFRRFPGCASRPRATRFNGSGVGIWQLGAPFGLSLVTSSTDGFKLGTEILKLRAGCGGGWDSRRIVAWI